MLSPNVSGLDGRDQVELGQVLAARRRELGLSLAVVAGRAGISKAYLHRLERPDSTIHPSADVVTRLMGTLGLDLATVLGNASGLRLPSGLAAYLAQEQVDEKDRHALTALVPYAGEASKESDWRFAHQALRRSILAE
jgi:transcriptional regulator with XRE-family HTH domain